MQGDYIRLSLLLDKLKEIFPNTLPTDTNLSLEDLRILQGQQQVIETIESLDSEDT